MFCELRNELKSTTGKSMKNALEINYNKKKI